MPRPFHHNVHKIVCHLQAPLHQEAETPHLQGSCGHPHSLGCCARAPSQPAAPHPPGAAEPTVHRCLHSHAWQYHDVQVQRAGAAGQAAVHAWSPASLPVAPPCCAVALQLSRWPGAACRAAHEGGGRSCDLAGRLAPEATPPQGGGGGGWGCMRLSGGGSDRQPRRWRGGSLAWTAPGRVQHRARLRQEGCGGPGHTIHALGQTNQAPRVHAVLAPPHHKRMGYAGGEAQTSFRHHNNHEPLTHHRPFKNQHKRIHQFSAIDTLQNGRAA